MSDVDQALQTQLANIEAKTGKRLPELYAIIAASPLTKHGELRNMVRETFGLGYGDANMLVHQARKALAAQSAPADPLDAIYSGSKAALRPLHDAVMTAIAGVGDFEVAPKKRYVSLRRKKQFAMVGPASRGRVEIGLNMKDVPPTDRLEALPPGRMCQFRVYLTSAAEVNDELLGWIRIAHQAAG